MKNGLRTIFAVVFLLERGVNAAITLGPSNTVAEIEDKQLKLNCTADAPIASWVLSKDGTTTGELTIIGPGCSMINAPFEEHYTTELLAGGRTCNLIIFNITMEQAGVYKCVQGTVYSASILTVIDSSPVITVNNTNDTRTPVESENVVIGCILNHNGSVASDPTLKPYFYWKNSSGQNVSSSYDSTTENTAVSQLTVIAGRQNITSYTCHVYLQLIPPTDPNYANNTPSVSNSGSSPTIQVLYYPGITNLTSSVSIKDKCVYKQENLTCTADANPPAHYEWLDLSTNAMTPGAVKSITSGGHYRCIAYNYIRTMRYNATDNATEDNCYPITENNMTITCTKDSCNCTGFQPLEITCEVYSLPKPTYLWLYNGFEYSSDQTFQVEFDGDYSCTANSSFGTNSSKATKSTRVFNCTPPISMGWIFVPVYVGVCWILGFLCFPIHYNVSKRKHAYNKRFPCLMKMLPCLNKDSNAEASLQTDPSTTASTTTSAASKADSGNVGWIIIYIVMVTFVGIFAIPIMFFTVQCSKCSKSNKKVDPENTGSAESKETADTESSEELADKSVLKQNENANSSSSTKHVKVHL